MNLEPQERLIFRLKKKGDNSERKMCYFEDFKTKGLLIDPRAPSVRDNLVLQ